MLQLSLVNDSVEPLIFSPDSAILNLRHLGLLEVLVPRNHFTERQPGHRCLFPSISAMYMQRRRLRIRIHALCMPEKKNTFVNHVLFIL